MPIGHWNTLDEAKKLTQSQLIPGVIEEDIYRNNLMDVVPVAQAKGKTIKHLREQVVLDTAVADVDIGEQLTWTANVTYEEVETELKRKAIQRQLDNFIPDVYGTINDYEAQVLWEMKKGIMRKLGKSLYYDDVTYGGAKQFDGAHALAAVQTGTNLDLDEGEGGLSLHNMRLIHDEMKHGITAWYMSFNIARRIDEAYQERGLVAIASGTAGTLAQISYGVNDQGKRIAFFDGVPIRRTDFLRPEDPNVGDGSDLRTQNESETNYSAFAFLFGDVFNQEPGFMVGFGNTEMVGQFYKIVPFDVLENYDAQGLRIVTYIAPILGSKLCLARIFDIEDEAVVA